MSVFKNPLDPENLTIKSLLKEWVRNKLQLTETMSIEIEEHGCNEASCVYAETIFIITDISTSEKTLYKITKPLTFIRKWDMDNLQKISQYPLAHKH